MRLKASPSQCIHIKKYKSNNVQSNPHKYPPTYTYRMFIETFRHCCIQIDISSIALCVMFSKIILTEITNMIRSNYLK